MKKTGSTSWCAACPVVYSAIVLTGTYCPINYPYGTVSMISCGALAPDSRLAKLIAVLLGVISARLYVPLPVM